MKRLHRRLFRLNDRITRIEEQIRLVGAELEHHRSINEDAQRDAAIGNHIDREEASLTAGDVRRFERAVAGLNAELEKVVAKRDRLLAKLPSS